ncbi:MAG TPA: SpoIIE family protein phosphatase [Mycobacteriales bacterium]|nr:SpoIIE family protein phosphatase [Mycobacteriales bacterium]
MPEAWHEELTLLPEETAPGRARRFVRYALTEHGWFGALDNALLLTTELTTNALVHAGTTITIGVGGDADGLTVRVQDHTPGRLAGLPRAPDELHEGGRGLYLVDTLSTTWGTEHTQSGKAVWFRFQRENADTDPPTPPPASAEALERISRVDLDWLTAAGSPALERLNIDELLGEVLWRLMETVDAAAGVVLVDDEESGVPALIAHHGVSAETAKTYAAEGEIARPALTRQLGTDDGLLLADGSDGDVLAVALSLDGVAFGWVELRADGSRKWNRSDLGLAQLAADRLALAVAGTRLKEADQRRRGWLGFLAEASELLAGSLDERLTLSLVAQLVLPTLADWSAVYLLDERGEPRLAAVGHVDERHAADLRERLEGLVGDEISAAVSSAVLSSGPTALTVAPSHLPVVGRTTTSAQHSEIVVPLSARGRTLGALVLARPVGPRHTAEERSLAEDLSRRAALAVDNARLYGDRAAVARALQAWLLPAELPTPPGIEFAARYLAAGEGNEVGGDFYDVFPLGDDGWGLAVGDVCGKGAEAAAVTGLVRDVIRLLVREGHVVSEVLQRLNRAILEQGDRGRFCTVAAGRVDREGDDVVLRVCSAGHPLPVLMRSSGDLEFLGRAGTLVGVTESFEVHEHTVQLGPGDAVVFYTDGVTERRTATRMFGELRLLDTLALSAGRSAAGIAADLERAVDQYTAEPLRDDLAILVVRRLP